MYILGIGGRVHDAAACLWSDGEIVAAVEEERLSRVKHAWGSLPSLSSRYCLDVAGIELDAVDCIVRSWSETRDDVKLYPHGAEPARLLSYVQRALPAYMFPCARLPRLATVSHHLAHASSAFRGGRLRHAGIVTLDGRGEHDSGGLWIGEGEEIRRVREFSISRSLGAFYRAGALSMNIRGESEGTLMALAAYGDRHYGFDEQIRLTDDGYDINLGPDTDEIEEFGALVSRWSTLFKRYLPVHDRVSVTKDWATGRNVSKRTFSVEEANFAAAIQGALEDVVLHISTRLMEDYGPEILCVAGGVGLNCALNGRLAAAGIGSAVFIPPGANDGGVPLGAVLEVASRWGVSGGMSSDLGPVSPYLGPGFSDSAIEEYLTSVGLAWSRCDDPGELAARLVASGRIVAWFQGRTELGPRALGNRSILASPGLDDVKESLNQVKHRDSFRPFALSILEEEAARILEDDSPSPFMLKAVRVRQDVREALKGGVHVDGTTRPQIVAPGSNPRFERLLAVLRNLSGNGAVVNTSFNDQGEPIVSSPRDAVRTFYAMAVTDMVIGSAWLSKVG